MRRRGDKAGHRGNGERMFDSLVIGYLFLGGAGGGALVVLGAFEGARTLGLRRPELPDELFARAWPVCAVALATGIVCIAADLGRPDRLLGLVASPRPTPLAVGAYALVAGLLCAAAFSALALFDGAASRVPRGVRLALAAASLAAGGVTAAYTGVLLQGLASVLFWQTPLAAGCVRALVAFLRRWRSRSWRRRLRGGAPAVRAAARVARARRRRAHSVLEAGVPGGVSCAWALRGRGHAPGGGAALVRRATWRPRFWAAWRLAGLAAPFAMERLLTHGNHRSQLLWIAACVLAGGLALRVLPRAGGALRRDADVPGPFRAVAGVTGGFGPRPQAAPVGRGGSGRRAQAGGNGPRPQTPSGGRGGRARRDGRGREGRHGTTLEETAS